MGIRELTDPPLLVLTGRASQYAFALDPAGGLPRHVHRGAELPDADLAALASAPSPRMWPFDPSAELLEAEIVPWGGLCFEECTLKLRFADGCRSLELRYDRHDIAGESVTVRLRDAHYPLAVDLRYAVVPGADVIRRSIAVANESEHDPVTVDRAFSASWLLPEGPWSAWPGVRAVGRAGDGQPGQRPLPRPSRLGLPVPAPSTATSSS